MPNWCSTDYCFHSDDYDELKRFFDLSKKVIEYSENKDSKYFKSWLGNFFILNNEDIDNNIPCKGEISYIDKNIENNHFYMETVSAWCPCNELFDYILSKYFKNIEYVYKAEEPGNDYFINSDIEHTYIPSEYYVKDFNIDNDEYEILTFDSESDIIEYYYELFNEDNIEFNNYNDVINFASNHGHDLSISKYRMVVKE